MLIISKSPKSIAGRTKHPRGPHAAHVFETPDPTQRNKITHRFWASWPNRPNTAWWYPCRSMPAAWMPNRDFLLDWPERRDEAFKPGLSRYVCLFLLVVQCVTVLNTHYQRSKLRDQSKTQHSTRS